MRGERWRHWIVNCAGGFWKQLSVEETPEDEWDNVIDLNLKSIFLCAKAAIPTFKRQRSGRIVNIGSMAGVSALTMSTAVSLNVPSWTAW